MAVNVCISQHKSSPAFIVTCIYWNRLHCKSYSQQSYRHLKPLRLCLLRRRLGFMQLRLLLPSLGEFFSHSAPPPVLPLLLDINRFVFFVWFPYNLMSFTHASASQVCDLLAMRLWCALQASIFPCRWLLVSASRYNLFLLKFPLTPSSDIFPSGYSPPPSLFTDSDMYIQS